MTQSHLRPDPGVFPLGELPARSAERYGERPTMRSWTGSEWRELSFAALRDRAHAIARWLIGQGIQPGDRVAVLSENRPEWGMSYLGVQCSGATAVPVDALMPAVGIRHVLADSEAGILFASAKFIKDLAEVAPVESLEKTVCFDEPRPEGSIPFETVLKEGGSAAITLPTRSLDELAAIIYTSGTTGHSKGVMLTQGNIMSNVAAASRIFPIGADDTFLSVLPIHHSFECTAGFLLPVYCGCSITYARSLKSNDLLEDIRNTRVTMMVGVPLLYEKMHQGVLRGIRKKGAVTNAMFKSMYGAVKAGSKLGADLGVKLFKGLREKAGFGTVRFFVSGGGPLDPATAKFFNHLGIKLMQGYGLTETSPVTHVNPPWKVSHETVGPPIPGVEQKIIDMSDAGVGEICLRGPNIFKGYYRNEEATREVLGEDGWFRTGDLGRIGADDYLQILGRCKNMLVTGGGKNVYPEEVEEHLNRGRFIAESLVLGQPRASGYGDEVVALIYPDYEQVDLHFEEQGRKATDEDVFRIIKVEIAELQKDLHDYKRVRRFRIVEEEFQKTSTRKIKRFLYKGEMVSVNEVG